ncbi:hypothetical protein TIFTF001_044675, partial [Ficus carica]
MEGVRGRWACREVTANASSQLDDGGGGGKKEVGLTVVEEALRGR